MKIKLILVIIICFVFYVIFSNLALNEGNDILPPIFSKKKMKNLYIETSDFCNKQSFATNGETLNCHFEYMKKQDSELLNDYIKIRDYCYYKNDTTFDTWQCVDNLILR